MHDKLKLFGDEPTVLCPLSAWVVPDTVGGMVLTVDPSEVVRDRCYGNGTEDGIPGNLVVDKAIKIPAGKNESRCGVGKLFARRGRKSSCSGMREGRDFEDLDRTVHKRLRMPACTSAIHTRGFSGTSSQYPFSRVPASPVKLSADDTRSPKDLRKLWESHGYRVGAPCSHVTLFTL
ncbi:hypothetical protein Bbelb_165070 [Branchiostoma belcheri]|nr:hypothetical protein Bbelb_165070 [Branchiostoma belcheri]